MTLTFLVCLHMKIKLNLTSRFTPSNLTFSSFKIWVLEISISTSLLRSNIFQHLLPSNFLKTSETFFLIVPCRLSSTFFCLKSMCKGYCHMIYIENIYIYIYIYNMYIYSTNFYIYSIKIVLKRSLKAHLKITFLFPVSIQWVCFYQHKVL